MSLVVTALKPQFVVQLSDMRLTDLGTQAVRHEEQRKAIVLNTADARVVVGWCGFATDRHNVHNTGDWLMDQLPRLAAQQPALRFPDFVNQLAASATAKFQSIAEPLESKACSVVMSGWAWPRPDIVIPMAVLVSNCEDAQGRRLPHTRGSFAATCLIPSKEATRKPALVVFSGTEKATPKELGKALIRLLRREPTPGQVINVCLRVMRDAAGHPEFGKLIGRNWVGVEMRRDSPGAIAHYFPEHDSPQEFMPNLVTPHLAFKDVRLWGGPGDPPWWT